MAEMAKAEFGKALRRWRDGVSPEHAGLPVGDRRRAPGLRREELASLAGISADYLTRLEQGRATNPSGQVVEALARALRLRSNERTHLFQLAGLVSPGADQVPASITPSVQRILDRLTGTPVAVFDATWTQLLANPLYVALFGERRGNDLNAVWRTFLGEGSRIRQTPQARRAMEAALVIDLRTTATRYPQDQRLHRLIARLRGDSPRFADLWDTGVVGTAQESRKTIDHPQLGALNLDCDVLTVADSDMRIMIYTAEPGTENAERLELLSVIGTQTITGQRPAAATDRY